MPMVLEVGKHKQREGVAEVAMFLIPAVALQVLLIKVPLVPGATVPTTIPLLRSPSIFVRRGVVATAGGRPALLVRRLCVASNKVFWYLKHPKAQLSDLEKKNSPS